MVVDLKHVLPSRILAFFLDKVTVAVYAAFLMKYVKQGNTGSSYEYRRTVH